MSEEEILLCLDRDDKGAFVTGDFDGEPFVLRLPPTYEPREDRGRLAVEAFAAWAHLTPADESA